MTTITISLPDQIADKLNLETEKQGYATKSEFIRSLLRSYFTGQLKLEEYSVLPIKQVKLELARSGKYSEKFIDDIVEGLKKSSKYAK